ncbi:hypothetical protein MMC10_007358 [Thelotrema lepadinum]|nr:hypothetical protein [Thelotrema lepadinum]
MLGIVRCRVVDDDDDHETRSTDGIRHSGDMYPGFAEHVFDSSSKTETSTAGAVLDIRASVWNSNENVVSSKNPKENIEKYGENPGYDSDLMTRSMGKTAKRSKDTLALPKHGTERLVDVPTDRHGSCPPSIQVDNETAADAIGQPLRLI